MCFLDTFEFFITNYLEVFELVYDAKPNQQFYKNKQFNYTMKVYYYYDSIFILFIEDEENNKIGEIYKVKIYGYSDEAFIADFISDDIIGFVDRYRDSHTKFCRTKSARSTILPN